ncbi:MAG TPA: hypothetical protein VNS32_15545 [Flavisolibacter sp.]|nr:hypothetical protein [Flavisolibacter sp.]
MAYQLMEVGRWHSKTRKEIYDYLLLLIDTGHIELLSKEPLLYQFTDKGKTIETIDDIERIAMEGG